MTNGYYGAKPSSRMALVTKLPYSITGGIASVSDKRTWSSYAKAVEAAQRLNMGIGFVLTENDPFAFIDLDDPFKNNTPEEAAKIIERHKKIIKEFDTYTEVSPSGTGLHIIPKGAVEGGRRRDKVEVYSSGRYMTMTGNTLHDKPIQDRGFLLSELWKECGGSNGNGHTSYIEERQQTITDEEIYNQALKAENGEKFYQLWQGHWVDAGYKSQSEADFALINILSFYSRNVEQIKRMFFLSALGQRDKAKRKMYIDNMVKRSFDNAPVYLPMDELKSNFARTVKGQLSYHTSRSIQSVRRSVVSESTHRRQRRLDDAAWIDG
jgi:primase-polymerase (primpol)-like protein